MSSFIRTLDSYDSPKSNKKILQEFCQNPAKQYYSSDLQGEGSEQQHDLPLQLKTNLPNQSLEYSTASITHHSSGSDGGKIPGLLQDNPSLGCQIPQEATDESFHYQANSTVTGNFGYEESGPCLPSGPSQEDFSLSGTPNQQEFLTSKENDFNIDFLLNNAPQPSYENAYNPQLCLFNRLQSQGSQSEEDIHSKFDNGIYFSSGYAPSEETYQNGAYFGNGYAASNETYQNRVYFGTGFAAPKETYQQTLPKRAEENLYRSQSYKIEAREMFLNRIELPKAASNSLKKLKTEMSVLQSRSLSLINTVPAESANLEMSLNCKIYSNLL